VRHESISQESIDYGTAPGLSPAVVFVLQAPISGPGTAASITKTGIPTTPPATVVLHEPGGVVEPERVVLHAAGFVMRQATVVMPDPGFALAAAGSVLSEPGAKPSPAVFVVHEPAPALGVAGFVMDAAVADAHASGSVLGESVPEAPEPGSPATESAAGCAPRTCSVAVAAAPVQILAADPPAVALTASVDRPYETRSLRCACGGRA